MNMGFQTIFLLDIWEFWERAYYNNDYRCVVSQISEEHRHQLPLTLDGTPYSKDFVRQVFRRLTVGLIVVNWRSFIGFSQVIAAFIAEFGALQI